MTVDMYGLEIDLSVSIQGSRLPSVSPKMIAQAYAKVAKRAWLKFRLDALARPVSSPNLQCEVWVKARIAMSSKLSAEKKSRPKRKDWSWPANV